MRGTPTVGVDDAQVMRKFRRDGGRRWNRVGDGVVVFFSMGIDGESRRASITITSGRCHLGDETGRAHKAKAIHVGGRR